MARLRVYIDDQNALSVRDLAVLREDIRIAQSQANELRDSLLGLFHQHNYTSICTDEYDVAIVTRHNVVVDKEALERDYPEVYKDVCSIVTTEVLTIKPRRYD